MKKNGKTSIVDMLQSQSSIEHDISAGNLTVLIRTRNTGVVPIKALEADPETDDSIVDGG